jgi:hypothetical protein
MSPQTVDDGIRIQEIDHGSPLYAEEIVLRDRILRAPLGFSFTDEELKAESDNVHIVAVAFGRVIGCEKLLYS